VEVYKKAHSLKEKMKENKVQDGMQDSNDQLVFASMKSPPKNMYESLKANDNKKSCETMTKRSI
jgi:hypothetical protein